MVRECLQWIESQPRSSIAISSIGLLVLVGVADAVTGFRVDLAIFYVVPILLVAWALGRFAGLVIAVMSAMTWWLARVLMWQFEPSMGFVLWDACVRGGFFVMLSMGCAALYAVQHREQTFVRYDPLTGLVNARAFLELARREVARCYRNGHPLTVVLFDCDNFKSLNERFGRATGDAVLCLAARTIRQFTRTVDIVGRFGDDELVILLPDAGDANAIQAIHRVQQLLLDVMRREDWPITFSVGVATFVKPPHTMDRLIQKAQHLVQIAKRSGKNQVKHASFAA